MKSKEVGRAGKFSSYTKASRSSRIGKLGYDTSAHASAMNAVSPQFKLRISFKSIDIDPAKRQTSCVSATSRAICRGFLTKVMITIVTALVSGEKTNFQFILRLLNTNVDGRQKIMYALTKIKGVGRRYSNLVCKKADVDLNKR